MRQRGRPRRSSMPAVAHNKPFDHPYGRQQQSPPDRYHSKQYQNSGPDSGADGEGEDDDKEKQLSDRYSRIQLVDHCSSMPPVGQIKPVTNSSISHLQSYFYSGLESQHQFDGNYPQQQFTELSSSEYLNYPQRMDDTEFDGGHPTSQDEEEEEDDEDEECEEEIFAAVGSSSKRKRAFSFSTASCASTTNTMTISLAAASAGSSTNFAPMEKRPATKICRVCGDRAYSYNFNVITCESCKAFFRRNANKEKEIRCPFNEQCEINTVSRRFCQRCRLQKCFSVGMKKEWIMSDEARLEKKQRIQENRERRAAAAVAVASISAALGLGGIKQNTEMDQNELELHPQQSRRSIKQEQASLHSDTPLTTASFIQAQQQQTEAAQRVEMLQVEALHAEQQQQLVSQVIHQQKQELANQLVTDLPSNPLAALQNPFNSTSAPLLNTPSAGEQVIAAAQVAAVQQVVNQAAAAVLLHHAQQQQIHQQHDDSQIEQNSQSEQQSQQFSVTDEFPPPVVGVPVGSSTSIHTTVAGSGYVGDVQQQTAAPAPALAALVAAVAGEAAAIQQQQQSALPSMNNTEGLQQHSSSLLASAGLISDVSSQSTMITTSNENSNTLPPAVAAALIQQQHNQQQIAHLSGTSANISTQQASNVNESIQQQIVASQQQHAAAVAQHLQHQQQAHASKQQVTAQIAAAAHVQQMQQIAQQQQQFAALANVAAVHHHQQHQLNQQSGTSNNNSFLTSGNAATAQNENVNQQLHQVASAFSAGNAATLQNSNLTTQSHQVIPPPTGILPNCFIEAAAAHLASQPQQSVQQPSVPPPNANVPILPSLIPQSTTQTSNFAMQQQSSIMSIGTGQLNSGNPPQQQPSTTSVQQQSITSANCPSQSILQNHQLGGGGHQFQTISTNNQQQSISSPYQLEMVCIPKDILLRLVEQRIESEKSQIQTPSKCLCHCNCGRYPNDVPIIDKVMTDLLEGSSKHLGGSDNNSINTNSNHTTSSNNSTPRNSLQSQPSHFQPVTNGQINLQQTTQQQQNILINPSITTGNFIENMDTSSLTIANSLQQLNTSDQEQLTELAKANEVWKNSATTSANITLTGTQSGDLQFLIGHYTESDLRRLIGVAKSLDAFKRLDQHDQERLLKGCFGSFFVLRSVLNIDVNEFTIAILRQNGVPESTIRFYVDFPVEWRRNETINLLLGLILLFNVEIADLQSAISVTVENMKFQSLLKRLLYVFCDRDSVRAETAAAELLARVEHLKQIFPVATLTAHNSVGSIGTNILNTGIGNSLAFSSQTIGQQQISSTNQLIECSNSSLSSS